MLAQVKRHRLVARLRDRCERRRFRRIGLFPLERFRFDRPRFPDCNPGRGRFIFGAGHHAASDVLLRWRVSIHAQTSAQRYRTDLPSFKKGGVCGSPSIRRLAQVASPVPVRRASSCVSTMSSSMTISISAANAAASLENVSQAVVALDLSAATCAGARSCVRFFPDTLARLQAKPFQTGKDLSRPTSTPQRCGRGF